MDEQLTIPGVDVHCGRRITAVSSEAGDGGAAQLPATPSVDNLGVRTDLVTACRLALGVGSTTAYALAGREELPFPVYRVGRQWVVPTAGLRTFLGLVPSTPVVP